MTKLEQYQEKPTIAYFSGYGGFEVKEIENGTEDYMIGISGTFSGARKYHRLKIYYGADESYVRLNGTRLKISDFIRNA